MARTDVPPYNIIAGSIACVAFICSVLTLYLIRKMKFNGFLLILTSLSVSQVIFDVAFLFLFDANDTDWQHAIYLYIDMGGEVMVAIWTNLLSLITLRIVYTLKTVNIYKEYPYYLFLDVSVPLYLVIYSAIVYGLDADTMQLAFRGFYWIRMFSVVFNVLCYGVTTYYVRQLIMKVSSGKLTSTQAGAITTLVGRMKYYSVVQVILITGACWNGYDKSTIHQESTYYAYFLTAPACGIGYFLVFLYMQPTAMKLFIKLVVKVLPCTAHWLLKETADTDDELAAQAVGEGREERRGEEERPSDSQHAIRSSMIPHLTDEQLARAIDARFSSSSRGVELSSSVMMMSAESGSDVSGGESINTGSILMRPQSSIRPTALEEGRSVLHSHSSNGSSWSSGGGGFSAGPSRSNSAGATYSASDKQQQQQQRPKSVVVTSSSGGGGNALKNDSAAPRTRPASAYYSHGTSGSNSKSCTNGTGSVSSPAIPPVAECDEGESQPTQRDSFSSVED